MHTRQLATVALVALLATRGTSVFAQSVWFVEGRALADDDRTLTMRSRITLGAGAAAGVFVTRKVSVRGEFDAPAWHVEESVVRSAPISGPIQMIHRRSVGGTLACSFLVAGHTKMLGPLQAAFLVGFALTHRASGRSSQIDTLDDAGGIAASRSFEWSSGYWWFTVPVGVDVSLRVARRLAIVPQLRMYVEPFPFPTDTPGHTILRPGIAIRWTFEK